MTPDIRVWDQLYPHPFPVLLRQTVVKSDLQPDTPAFGEISSSLALARHLRIFGQKSSARIRFCYFLQKFIHFLEILDHMCDLIDIKTWKLKCFRFLRALPLSNVNIT